MTIVKLLIDIGNSRIKWCLYDNAQKLFAASGAMHIDITAQQNLFSAAWGSLASCPEKVLVSNVSGQQIAESLNAWVQKQWQIETQFVHTEAASYGVRNAYDDYNQLGVDRWLAIIAAWHRYRDNKRAICVVDCGTATTIDGISESGQHLGGFIFPGYTMMQEALVSKTSAIDAVTNTVPSDNFSNATVQAVSNGCYLATLATIDRVVASMKQQYGGDLLCVITGGVAELVHNQLATAFDHEPDLVLHGLALFSGREE